VLAFLATVPGPIQHLDAGAEPGYARALARSWSVRWPSVLVVSLLSAGLAWYCRCRQKRYAQPWTGVWMALVFLGGLPGLVGYLFHRSWPPREPCPNCGHTVPRDREACSACGKEFPPPQRTGVEVFA
jgi:hypothetical protein